jgi:hypothetical protein
MMKVFISERSTPILSELSWIRYAVAMAGMSVMIVARSRRV